MTRSLDFRKGDERRDAVHQAVHVLVEGGSVGLPTETGYTLAACATSELGCRMVAEAASKQKTPAEKTSTLWQLLLADRVQWQDFFPPTSKTLQRLMRRSWPGPLAVQQSSSRTEGLLSRLPPELWGGTRQSLMQVETRARICRHPAVREILDFLPQPLLILDESAWGNRVVTVEEVARASVQPSLILDDGPVHYRKRSSVVWGQGGIWRVIEPGAYSTTEMQAMAAQVFLFVCTGNTCRSPMAEALFRKYAAERIGCAPVDLPMQGVIVESAGLAAAPGMSASPDSVLAVKAHGIDLSEHRSQPVTGDLLDRCDYVFTMTSHHRDAILSARPDLSERVRMLSPDDEEISDPIGGTQQEYLDCCHEIDRHVRKLADLIEVGE